MYVCDCVHSKSMWSVSYTVSCLPYFVIHLNRHLNYLIAYLIYLDFRRSFVLDSTNFGQYRPLDSTDFGQYRPLDSSYFVSHINAATFHTATHLLLHLICYKGLQITTRNSRCFHHPTNESPSPFVLRF